MEYINKLTQYYGYCSYNDPIWKMSLSENQYKLLCVCLGEGWILSNSIIDILQEKNLMNYPLIIYKFYSLINRKNHLIEYTLMNSDLVNSYTNINKMLNNGANLPNGSLYTMISMFVNKINSAINSNVFVEFFNSYIKHIHDYTLLLIDNGADINETTIYHVINIGDYSYMKFMIEKGLKIEVVNDIEEKSKSVIHNYINCDYFNKTNFDSNILNCLIKRLNYLEKNILVDDLIEQNFVKMCKLLFKNSVKLQYTVEIQNLCLRDYIEKCERKIKMSKFFNNFSFPNVLILFIKSYI
jgi:hypothetical protein